MSNTYVPHSFVTSVVFLFLKDQFSNENFFEVMVLLFESHGYIKK